MCRGILLAMLVSVSLTCWSQKIPLINSGEIIAQGKALYDSTKYDEAERLYLKITERDTNYVYMLSELALTYIASEKYDNAIETCQKGLEEPSMYRGHFLKSQAVATDKKGEPEAAIKLFKEAIAEFPTDPILLYDLGITYLNHKSYEKAEETFFKVLSISPFHPGSHLNLARIAIGQGRKTHAMFSLGIYLSLNNQDNGRLVWLNNFVDNQVSDEGTLPVFGSNAADKLDQIIRAKIAMDKNFKSSIPVAVPVVKQFEMMFTQLGSVNINSDDAWLKFYYSIYKHIKEQNAVDAFVYHILASSANESVKKWLSKNEKPLSVFYDAVNNELKQKRDLVALPSYGFEKPTKAWYDDENALDALGEKLADDVHIGPWITFHDNHTVAAKGQFNEKGLKAGTWHYYYNDGKLKSIENFDTNEVTQYFPNGNKRERFFLNDGKINGDVDLFYECGILSERVHYKDDLREGKGTQFYPNGKTKMTYAYTNSEATGEFVSYFENGKVSNRTNYKNGKIHGKYISFFSNGKIKLEGEYQEDNAIGTWKYYYSNGNIDYTGSYVNGIASGEWKYFDTRGVLLETRLLNSEGDFHGDNLIYVDGKLYIKSTYKNGMLIKVAYYSADGTELGKGENKDGNFKIKSYYTTGQLRSEGEYKKGKQHGEWKYYFRNGKLQSEFKYADGLIQGTANEYYETGEKRYVSNYKNNDFDGYFQELYESGQVKLEGWSENGNRSQKWLSYYPDGKPETDYYYLAGDYHGKCYDYTVDGKLGSFTEYDKGAILNIQSFDTTGASRTVTKVSDLVNYTELYSTGKTRSLFQIECGDYGGMISKWFPDGTVYFSYGMKDGKRHGAYTFNFPDGRPATRGNMEYGSKEGKWENFHENGKLANFGNYLNDKRDSLWTFFYPTGTMSATSWYINDERHGFTQVYSPEGLLLMEKKYDNGDLISYRVQNDNAWSDWTPFKGDGIISVKFPDGSLAFEETYKDFLRDGYKRTFFRNGTPCDEYTYKGGDFEGPYEVHYANGNVSEKGSFKKDEKDGIIEYFEENGSPLRTETYKMGVRQGKCTLYEKGKKSKEFTFWDGMTYE
jgi:antitoxin component YwqK of YwqJK toxin-antitoxin module/Flp pilus assembly protein TadD